MSIIRRSVELLSDNRGLTTVELLITIIVSAIFVISTSTIYTTQVYLNQRSRDHAVLNSFVEGKVESLRSAGFLSLANGTTDITNELPAELSEPRSASMEISPYNTSIKEVGVTISYNEQGQARTYSYTTFIGELGVGQY